MLEVRSEFGPGHPRRTAHEDVRMLPAFFIGDAFEVGIDTRHIAVCEVRFNQVGGGIRPQSVFLAAEWDSPDTTPSSYCRSPGAGNRRAKKIECSLLAVIANQDSEMGLLIGRQRIANVHNRLHQVGPPDSVVKV